LKASGGSLSATDLMRPGFVASAGFTAAHPLLEETGQFSGFDVLTNLPTILILLFCWILIVLAFFVLSVQLFVTLIEFKLTTLASFILVPFALWGKTSFLAEKTLGNVIASGVKVMVLAIIIGIGSTIFAQLATTLTRPVDITSAMSLLLAALSLFGLGIFGPGIAAGLVSGAPQLGAGAAAGTVAGAAAAAIGGGLRAAAGGSMSAVRSAASLAGASPGRTAAAADSSSANQSAQSADSGQLAGGGRATSASDSSGFAGKVRQGQQVKDAMHVAGQTLKEGDKGGHSSGPKLGED
jgi:type IV secretion system protein TrbL